MLRPRHSLPLTAPQTCAVGLITIICSFLIPYVFHECKYHFSLSLSLSSCSISHAYLSLLVGVHSSQRLGHGPRGAAPSVLLPTGMSVVFPFRAFFFFVKSSTSLLTKDDLLQGQYNDLATLWLNTPEAVRISCIYCYSYN